MKPCPAVWENPTVDWNGDVLMCNVDIRKEQVIGNIRKMPLKEIWEGDKINEIRAKHLLGDLETLSPCCWCSGMMPIDQEMFIKVLKNFVEQSGRKDLQRALEKILQNLAITNLQRKVDD